MRKTVERKVAFRVEYVLASPHLLMVAVQGETGEVEVEISWQG
jgi:hypothetical protein